MHVPSYRGQRKLRAAAALAERHGHAGSSGVQVDEQQVVVLVLRPLVEDERLESWQAGVGREPGQQRRMVSD